MKKIKFVAVLVFCVLAIVSIAWSDPPDDESDEKPPETWCPKTRITDNNKCMDCHLMTNNGFGLKEVPPTAQYSAEPYGLSVEMQDGKLVGYIKIAGVEDNKVKNAYDYLMWHPEIKHVIIEFHTPGGSVMDAWRAVGYIEDLRARGVTIETRCYGMTASAGFLLFVAGDKGHRFVNPHAELMTHKLWTFKMFALEDPDSSEDEAEMMKHFQSNLNDYILSRTGLTKEQLLDKTYKKDWWMTGYEAVELGVADGFIGDFEQAVD